MDEQDTRQNRVEEVCCTKCFIVSVMSFHVYFDKKIHKNWKKKISKKNKLKAWILLNQTRTEKQTRAAALRHTIYFLALPRGVVATPHRFPVIRVLYMMLYLVLMYRSRFPLSVATKISTNNFHVISLWCPIHQNIFKKWPNFVFDDKNPRNIWFSPYLWKKFLRINSYFYVCLYRVDCTNPHTLFWTTTLPLGMVGLFVVVFLFCFVLFFVLFCFGFFCYKKWKGWENNVLKSF